MSRTRVIVGVPLAAGFTGTAVMTWLDFEMVTAVLAGVAVMLACSLWIALGED